jgi:hypothetical protein
MLPLSLFLYDGTGCAGMQEEFLTSVAHIKKKLRLDIDSASVRLTESFVGSRFPCFAGLARLARTATTPHARRRFSRQRLGLAPHGSDAERHRADHQHDA